MADVVFRMCPLSHYRERAAPTSLQRQATDQNGGLHECMTSVPQTWIQACLDTVSTDASQMRLCILCGGVKVRRCFRGRGSAARMVTALCDRAVAGCATPLPCSTGVPCPR